MKVFNKNSVSVFPSTFIDGQVHYKNIIHFLEHFWLDVFVAVVRFFLFPKWCLSFLRSNEQRTRPQHLSGTCYLLGLSPGTQKEGSKGVNWSAVFCSVVCQSHQRNEHQWGLGEPTPDLTEVSGTCTESFRATLPFISMKLGFGPISLSHSIYPLLSIDVLK